MNKAILIGRLTRDVELRYTQSNIACATFDLAINNGKDKDGNDRQADFIRCVLWEKQAENMAKYTHKGSQVAVDGSIKTENWPDEQTGQKKYRTYVLARTIQYLDSKRTEEPLPQEPDYILNQSNNQQEENDPFASFGESVEITDNDLPF
ncbi:MAG: single-stranded DNA-binding protein [Bacilli bacterium]